MVKAPLAPPGSALLEDLTGLDSLVSPVVSLVVFFAVHYGEKATGKPWRFVPESWVTPKSEPAAVPAETKSSLVSPAPSADQEAVAAADAQIAPPAADATSAEA